MDQHNVNGTNIGDNHGQITNNYFYDTDTEWLVPYNIIMASNRKKQFLPDASEYLIESGKVCLNTFYINAVQQYLNDYNVCLIKAPEGRGKTFLSRIIAYYCHKQEREVFFVDFSRSKDKKDKEEIKLNSIKKALLSWNEDREKKYLLVLENVHAYQQLYELAEEINGWSSDTEFNNSNIWFLLNARPTDEGVDYFSDWNGIVDLKPDKPDIDEIIKIYSKEVGREPFPNVEAKEEFINEKIYPQGNNSNGTNLRLLGYYLKTWQEKAKAHEIYYVTNVNEEDIIERIKCFYNIDTIDEDDLIVLLYISCIFQFDAPLDNKIIDQSRLFEYDNITIKNTKRLEKFIKNKGVLRKKQGLYSLPHSFDAYYLCKAICNYIGKDYIQQTNEHVYLFINTILGSKEPRKYEGDFRMLIQGLIQRKEEFQVLVNELADWPMAEKIIRNIDSGFVIKVFNPQNGHSSKEILDYYKANLDWLKTSILEINPVGLNLLCYNFNKYLKHNIIKDIFKDPKDLENYLRINDKVFVQNTLLEAISGIGEKHKHVLIDYYKQNIDSLKPSFHELSPTKLYFIYRFFKSDLNIIKDIFKDPKDLENYLRINDKVFLQNRLLEAISGMGVEYKRILIDYYKQNIDRLKPYFLELSPSRLYFIYRSFKSDLNVFKDIFKDPKDLENYLRIYDKVFLQHDLEAISGISEKHKHVLIDYYKQNIDRLKPSFLELSPTSLTFVYKAYKKQLDYNIVEDIFINLNDFDEYLRNHNDKVLLDYNGIIKAIRDLGKEYRLIHKSFMVQNGYDYFFYSRKRRFCISQYIIDFYWYSKKPFDIFQIKENDFMFYEVHWEGLGRFVKIISYNINDDNRKHSINIVKAIIQIVLNSKESLSHASAHDLSLFYANIASVDKNLFKNLINERFVIKDIKHRLSSQKYSLNDLRLFSHFYDEEWFYRDMKKIVNRTLESLNEADEKDLSTFLGNISHMNAVFYNDLIVNETVVGIAKKRFETFSFREDYLYLFGHFYSQDWCKDEMNLMIDKADKEQQKVIKEWHDIVLDGLQKEGKAIEEGTLLAYIHNKPFIQQQNN